MDHLIRLEILRDTIAEVRNYRMCSEGDLKRLKKREINEIQYITAHAYRLKDLSAKLDGLKEIGE